MRQAWCSKRSFVRLGFLGAWNVYRVCEWEKGVRAQLMNFFKNP